MRLTFPYLALGLASGGLSSIIWFIVHRFLYFNFVQIVIIYLAVYLSLWGIIRICEYLVYINKRE